MFKTIFILFRSKEILIWKTPHQNTRLHS